MIVGLLQGSTKGGAAWPVPRMTIEEVVRKVLLDEHADVIREAVKAVAAEMMELEVSELIGAELGERRPEDRATHRNGYRPRRWDTRAGEMELQIPKIRQGSYFPSFLEPRSAVSRRCWRWSSRRMCAGSRPAGSTSWSSAWGCGSPRPRSAGCAPRWMSTSRRSGRARWRAATHTCSSTQRWSGSVTAAAWSTRRW